MTTSEEIARLRGLHESSTPAPWSNSPSMGIVQTQHLTRDVWVIPRSEVDLDLIVSMRNALPALLDDVERLQARVAELEALLRVAGVGRDRQSGERDRAMSLRRGFDGEPCPECKQFLVIRIGGKRRCTGCGMTAALRDGA